mmetsp:Transcript_51876/g.155688  ORF Transcript_51876/g.155688 Transcript_51876/m.155688 type:complete len:471 (-) Transcript_51876:219-1631(-)
MDDLRMGPDRGQASNGELPEHTREDRSHHIHGESSNGYCGTSPGGGVSASIDSSGNGYHHNHHPSYRSTDSDRLERCGRWLLSIPRDDVLALQQTAEYSEFVQAFERLGCAHRRAIAQNQRELLMECEADEDRMVMSNGEGTCVGGGCASSPARLNSETSPVSSPRASLPRAPVCSPRSLHRRSYSFLQHLAVDDVVLSVLSFLDCAALVRTSRTCHRIRSLTRRSASQRTHDMAGTRVLADPMRMLRAKEQIEGVGPTRRRSSGGVGEDTEDGWRVPFVRVPMLGLSRRVEVNGAGDEEYNGVYFCTGSNGNGFLFTKPRVPERRVRGRLGRGRGYSVVGEGNGDDENVALESGRFEAIATDTAARGGPYGEEAPPGRLLRCVIAKRFSNETILWYISKEVETINAESGSPEITQVFSFWAKLMVIGDATPDICRYPSQTSILSRNGDPAWQSLSSTRTIAPPLVELLD